MSYNDRYYTLSKSKHTNKFHAGTATEAEIICLAEDDLRRSGVSLEFRANIEFVGVGESDDDGDFDFYEPERDWEDGEKLETAIQVLNEDGESYSFYKSDDDKSIKKFILNGGATARKFIGEDFKVVFHEKQISIYDDVSFLCVTDKETLDVTLTCEVDYDGTSYTMFTELTVDNEIKFVENAQFDKLVNDISLNTENDLIEFNEVYNQKCDLEFMRENIVNKTMLELKSNKEFMAEIVANRNSVYALTHAGSDPESERQVRSL